MYSIYISTEKQRKGYLIVETKFMRGTAGYSLLNHRGNEDTSEELDVDPVEGKCHSINKTD
jgi:hypothetical protein